MTTKNPMFAIGIASLTVIGIAFTVMAASTPVKAVARMMDANGHTVGVITLSETDNTTTLNFLLRGLSPGKHGIHMHASNSCDDTKDATSGANVTFGAAGPHFDPNDTKNHGGPNVESDKGHAGDLENLVFKADGSSRGKAKTQKVVLSGGVLSVLGRSIIIHANQDNYTNTPVNGGSGARVACGIIELR